MPPTDPKQLVNPSTLIFAYTPGVEDPAVYAKGLGRFHPIYGNDDGEEGRVLSGGTSNAAKSIAMRSGRLHVAGFNTGSNPIAVNCAGFVPVRHHGNKDGQFGYEMEPHRAGRQHDQDASRSQGQEVAFTDPTVELPRNKAPLAILKEDFNLMPDRDFTAVFSGKHDNSVIGVANKDYDAAAVANEVMFRMFDRNVVDRSKIRTIYKSETFPTTGYG